MVEKIKAFSNMAGQQGMDLRDYFAAKAMQAMIQASTSLNSTDVTGFDDEHSFETAVVCGVNSPINIQGEDKDGKSFMYTWAQYYAEESYEIANAMMKARDETRE